MNISTRGNLNGESGDLTFTVGGMDCGSCAAKIETALSRLPGVADVKVSVARERLNLSLAEDKTSVAKIEDTLRKLGFKPALLPQEKAPREKIAAEPHDHDHDHSSCGGHHPAEAAPSVEQNNALTFSVGGIGGPDLFGRRHGLRQLRREDRNRTWPPARCCRRQGIGCAGKVEPFACREHNPDRKNRGYAAQARFQTRLAGARQIGARQGGR